MEWDKEHDEVYPSGPTADGDSEAGSITGEKGGLCQRAGLSQLLTARN